MTEATNTVISDGQGSGRGRQSRAQLIQSMVDDGLCRADAESCLEDLIARGLVKEYVDGTVGITSIPRALYYRAALKTASHVWLIKRMIGFDVGSHPGAKHGYVPEENPPHCIETCQYAASCPAAQEALDNGRIDPEDCVADTHREGGDGV